MEVYTANVGDLITMGNGGYSGYAPGQNVWNMSGKQGTVIGTRSVNGQQYYNIDFSKAPGGAGQGTGWVSGNYVNNSPAPAPAPAPTQSFNSVDDVTNHLNDYQTNSLNSTVPGVQSAATIQSNIESQLPQAPPPAYSSENALTTLSNQYGLDKLQSNINDLSSQEEQIQNQLKVNQDAEQSKPVAMNVIQGRMGQEATQANEQLAFIGAQKQHAVDQYNSALSTVKMIMDAKQTDYQNAEAQYQDQYSKAINMINMVQGIQKDQMTLADQAKQSAMANLTVIMNNIKDGSTDYNSMSPDQKASINKMEVQAGLPVGFLSQIQVDPKANIISTTSNNGQIQVLMRNPNGGLSLQTYGTPNKSTASTSRTALNGSGYSQKDIGDAIKILDQEDIAYTGKGTADKLLSRSEQEAAYTKILAAVGGDQKVAQAVFQQAWDVGGYGNYGN